MIIKFLLSLASPCLFCLVSPVSDQFHIFFVAGNRWVQLRIQVSRVWGSGKIVLTPQTLHMFVRSGQREFGRVVWRSNLAVSNFNLVVLQTLGQGRCWSLVVGYSLSAFGNLLDTPERILVWPHEGGGFSVLSLRRHLSICLLLFICYLHRLHYPVINQLL